MKLHTMEAKWTPWIGQLMAEDKELFSVLLSSKKRGMQKMSKKRRNHSPEFKSKVVLTEETLQLFMLKFFRLS